MEIRVLQYFMAAARHENITKAAEELHLTQPTLSRQLSDLEDELGVQLLVRGKRKTQLMGEAEAGAEESRTDIQGESAGDSQPDRKDEGAVCQDG